MLAATASAPWFRLIALWVVAGNRDRPSNPFMNLPILYIKRGCPWCDEVVDYLERKKIEVKTLVVSNNREAMQEMVELSGQSKAPTMDWHGKILADFGVDELVPFLKKQGVD
jgi:glutaredoxin